MRRIVWSVMGTLSALVLLFSYRTSLGGSVSQTTPSTPTTSPSSTTSTTTGGGSSSGSFTGEAVDTRWGLVQVKITVSGGKITKSEAVEYPANNPRDQEINAYALPQLNNEAVKAQSGSIDAVSGATVTSDGYIQSLQSAVDKAHL